MENAQYIYRGLLGKMKEIPSLEKRNKCAHITFSADDLTKWSLEDDPGEQEWKGIPATKKIEDMDGEKVFILTGNFSNVYRLNLLKEMERPSFWVPLSTRTSSVPHFPIAQNKYPIVELTYRMQYGKCMPAWTWHYTTGQFFEFLNMDFKWTTVARAWCYNTFPRKMENFALRLYSFTRTKETMYIHSIRFREPTEEENKLLNSKESLQINHEKPITYPILNNFFPMGTYINANTAKDMAYLLKTDLSSYLDLLFEDISLHYHNTVFVEDFYDFLPGDQEVLFDISEKYNIKLILPLEEENTRLELSKISSVIKDKEHTIKRYASDGNLFGWVIKENPSDEELEPYLRLKKEIERIDEKHPVIYLTREANAFPLYAAISSVSGLTHWKTRNPWELGQLIKTHIKFVSGQQLWAIGPTFVFGSGAPEWNSAPEIRLMINLALSNGARGWLSYTYHNIPLWAGGECQRSLTGPFLTFSDIWQELGGRLGRFYALAPLLMSAKPSAPPDFAPDIQSRKHPRSRCPESIDILANFWMKGNDFWIFYLINQDTSEVTGINVNFHSLFPDRYRIYDATQFVRTYKWEEIPKSFHREMFPGQGQILLITTPEVYKHWEEIIAKRIFESVEQQAYINIKMQKPYLTSPEKWTDEIKEHKKKEPIDALNRIVETKNQITNSIYSIEELYKSRGKLLEIGSILCACDGVLCRLLDEGKTASVDEYKDMVIKAAGDLIKYRISIYKGEGKVVLPAMEKLSKNLLNILQKLRQNTSNL